MTDLSAPSTDLTSRVHEPAAPAPVLITVGEVALGTAAAAGLPRHREHHRVRAFLRGALPRPTRHYASRPAFMEEATMRREMYRL